MVFYNAFAHSPQYKLTTAYSDYFQLDSEILLSPYGQIYPNYRVVCRLINLCLIFPNPKLNKNMIIFVTNRAKPVLCAMKIQILECAIAQITITTPCWIRSTGMMIP